MKVTQTATLKFASTATAPAGASGMPPIQPAGRQVAIGSGGFITPAVAAHLRKQMAARSRPSSQE